MSGEAETGDLRAMLLAHAPAELREALGAMEGLEELLQRHLEAGRTAWPSVQLPTEAFVRHLARHLPPADTLAQALQQLYAADLYLACACAAGESQALLAFEQHVLQKVPSRLGQLPASTMDEVLQLLRQRLLMSASGTAPKIADYAGRGPLAGWVRISAVRVTGELATHEGRQELFGEPPAALERMLAADDPERVLAREDSRQALTESLQAALARLSERERALLRMHHIHGLTMDRLATMYGEPRSSVARRVVQARERLLKLTRLELSSRLKLEGRELESLLGWVSSRLDVSLHRLMS